MAHQSSSGHGFHYLGDTTYTKVFVGGLAWETQSDTMRSHFQQFGDILEAVVISDKNTGRSKGYGFVTFREADSARRACADPIPIIDGRRANCNLASLGRPRPPMPYGHLRPASQFLGGPRGAYVGNVGYQQPIPYGYQHGLVYPPYGYTAYGPEYVYPQPQGVYNDYMGQQYLAVYGAPYGGHNYAAMQQGYAMPGHQLLQIGVTTSPIQAPYPAGSGLAAPVAAQPQFRISAPPPPPPPRGMRGSGSDQTVG